MSYSPIAHGQGGRERMLRRLRGQLERHHYPRLAMCAVLAAGGLAGFLTSAGLLQAGLRSMAWRYGIAALVGYGVFLLGLRVWLTLLGRRRLRLEDAVDAPDLFRSLDTDAGDGFEFGGGGSFSGAGAGGALDAGPGQATPALEGMTGVSGADAADAGGALDDGLVVVVPILLAAFVAAGLVGVVAVLVGAPALLAELLLDGVIAGTAYRRLRGVPVRHWLHGAVRRTWRPMLALTLGLVATGFAMQWLVPAADSIGDVLSSELTHRR